MDTIYNLNSRILLVILDGYGINKDSKKNAIKDAKTPNFDKLFSHYPLTLLNAGGEQVGLPKGIIGNSEVGHMNIGAGRPIRQDLVRINQAIENNSLKDMEVLKKLINHSQKGSKRIHLMGLLSDAGVHSDIKHIKEVIKILKSYKDLKIFFHAFMDGRDTARDSGKKYIKELNDIEGFYFASMQGRSIGMDRDRRWVKIKNCYDTLTGKGKVLNIDPAQYITSQYQQEIYDEFITPVLFDKDYSISAKDSVFFLNFRPDRAAQITLALCDPNFKEFDRPYMPAFYLCMTPYVPDDLDLPILFNREEIKDGLSEFISNNNLYQFKIAETEKYAHVTYFFNGGRKKLFNKEEQLLINSPKDVSTYDQKPEMSAFEVTENLLKKLEDTKYSFYLVNYANSDMVGHTGNYDAAVKSIEYLDDCVGQLMESCLKNNIVMILTSDHGNSDQMTYEDNTPHTSHSNAPVPFAIFDKKLKDKKIPMNKGEFSLKDIAPTILYIMGYKKPKSFKGINIFK